MKATLAAEIDAILIDYGRRAQAGDISENSLKAIENSFRHLKTYWGELGPKDVTKEKWAEFQDWFEAQSPGASQFNVKKYMTVLVRKLHEDGKLKKKFVVTDRFARRETVARRKKKNWVYTKEEIDALDKACSGIEERIQLRLGYLMGFRVSDICRLTWERIVIGGKYAYVEFTGNDDKAGTVAQCPIPNALLEMILTLSRKSKFVFHQKRNPDRPLKPQQINFNEIKRRAKVTRGSMHSLRHYCLSRDFTNPKLTMSQVCKMRRVSMQVAQAHYIHMSEDDMRILIEETK